MLFPYLFKRWPQHYFRLVLIATRIFPSFIAGFITIYYINLNAALPISTFVQFRFLSVIIIALAMVVTAAYGLHHLRDFPKLIRGLKANQTVSLQLQKTTNKIVTFPMRQLIFEAWYGVSGIPAVIWLLSSILFDFPAHAAFHLMVGGSMAVFITVFFNHLIFDRAIQEPLAFLFKKGIYVDYDRAKKFSLKSKLIVSFLLVTLPTVLMVGTLANQKVLDILHSGVISIELLYSLRLQIILIAIVAFSIAATLALSIATSITSPINSIENVVKNVREGDLSQRVLAIQNNEIGNLARQVNTMIQRVQESTTDLEKKVKERSDQLIQAQKLASIGQLVAGIAHHINNKINPPIQGADILKTALTNIKSGTSSLEENLPDMEVALDCIGSELSAVKTIVDDLLISSRQASHQFQFVPLDLNALIQSAVRMIRTDCLERVKIHEEYAENLPEIRGDQTYLDDVFVNLIKNAVEAIRKKGNVWIKTWNEDRSNFISVRDDGVGISEENLSKIFDFFFTTKDVGKGTGLGLSVSYATIKEHGGDISVKSRPSAGTEFMIRLPVL